MKRLISLLGATLLFATACESDTKNLEVKIDALNQKMDRLLKQGVGGGQQQRPQRPEPKRDVNYAVNIDGDPFDGPADALVTVVKAYDYACPFCEKVRGTMDDLRAKYPNDLRVVYKQLVVHPNNAMAGALAFCAAARQGKHKDMDRLIWDKGFNNNRTLDNSDVTIAAPAEQQIATGGQPGSAAPAAPAQPAKKVKCWDTPEGCKHVVSYAQELQLDVAKFKADMKDCQQLVAKDERELKSLLVSATPAFFVNGRYISGAVPLQQFIPVIEEELKKAKERVAQGTPRASYYQTWIVGKGQKTAP